MHLSEKLDALVVGAGPVGLTMACELRRYGLTVRIVDKAAAATDTSKALAMWPRTLEHLDRMGIAERFVAAGLKAYQAKFFQEGEPFATIPMDAVASPFPFGLMIPQSETERLLTERLRELGVDVERSKTLTALEQDAEGVTAVVADADGGVETIVTPWLIGADGAHSTVRSAVKAEFAGKTLSSDWVLADVQLQGAEPVETVELHLHREGVLGLFPVPPNRVRLIANVHNGNPDPTLEQMQGILDARAGRNLTAQNPAWLSGFHINERKVAEFQHGHVFLAGDAAHIHSPAGGQGMNTGMQDAVNLAWKLALASRRGLSRAGKEALLASYSAERGPVAERVLAQSGFLTQVGTTDNAFLRGLRKYAIGLLTGFEAVQHVVAEQLTELAVAYPKSPLNMRLARVDGPKPGERAPIRPGDAPVSVGDVPRFAVYAAPGDNTDTLIACYPTLIEPSPRPPFAQDGLWVVRPDGYVVFAGTTNIAGFATADAWFRDLIYEKI